MLGIFSVFYRRLPVLSTGERIRYIGVNVYLYFCAVCGAIAVGLLFAAVVDYFMEKSKCHGKHEQRGAK